MSPKRIQPGISTEALTFEKLATKLFKSASYSFGSITRVSDDCTLPKKVESTVPIRST